jgi:TonB family protein
MFSNLLASAPKRNPLSPSALGVSTITHVLAVLAVMWLTGRAMESPARAYDDVTYVDIGQEVAPPPEPVQPPPPPPAPVADPVEVTRPDLPEGFQELVAPREILASIPAPGRVEIKAEDFSGLGLAGGVAGGRPLIPSDTARVAPSFEPPPVSVDVVDKHPRVINLQQIRPFMQELYPPHYRMADIEGQAVVQLVVDARGRVESEHIDIVSSTHPEFEPATREVARMLRWEPATRNGRPVRVWVRMPVNWTID